VRNDIDRADAGRAAREATDVPKIVAWYMDKTIEIDRLIMHTLDCKSARQFAARYDRWTNPPGRPIVRTSTRAEGDGGLGER
jgi:hypothetical protein